MRQAVVLAGGKGSRLAERLNGKLKPLVEVDGVPLLERQIRELARFGIREAVVLVNHAADQIETFFAGRGDLGCAVRLIDDGSPKGTAGATLACLDALDPAFLVIYGDTLFNIDIARFVAAHRESGADATLFLHPNDHPHDSDLVEVDEAGAILAFHGYPHPEDAWLPNLVNAAFYAVEREALAPLKDFATPCDFAKDLFPALLKAGAKLRGYRSFEYIKDLGAPKRLDKVERHLRTGVVARASLTQPQACIFLDRDGTLNALRDYVRSPEALALLPGAAEAVRLFNDAEFRVALVTNQPVIARGDVDVAGLARIHAKLETELGRAGAFLDLIRYCPHHPDAGFPGERADLKMACACRKPQTGLVDDAAQTLNSDRARSWFVGDSTADMLTANRAGVRAVLVRTGEGGRDGKHPGSPDFIVEDVLAAARLITVHHPLILRRAEALLDAIGPGDLVLIGGPARAGKSTAAAVIADALRRRGQKAAVVSLDRWIKSAERRAPGLFGRFDLDAARAALGPWLAGESIDAIAATYDRQTRRAGPLAPLVVGANEILILEGVPALAAAFETKRITHRCFLEADEPLRAERVLRDLLARGAAGPEEAARTHEARLADEYGPVLATKASAQWVFSLDGGPP